MTTQQHWPLVIIGSGAAGYTAGIYSRRAMIDTLMIEGLQPGGQLTITSDVENFPGYASIMGPELMMKMREHAEKFDLSMHSDMVDSVDLKQHPFTIHTMNEKTLTANAIIVATGASARFLGIPGEKEFMGRGVSGCATCDGFFFRDKVVMVAGGGDTAMEDATYLTNHARKVYIVHRRDELRASKFMQKKAMDNPKIEILWNTTLAEVLGSDEDGVTGVRLASTVGDPDVEKEVTGVFLAIGHTPNTAFLGDAVQLDDKGYMVWTRPGRTETSVEGVFAAGDVADSNYRQAITAAGTGCMAALDAERWLATQEG